MQTLLDVVADIPGILEESDEFLKGADGERNRDQHFMCDRILSTLRTLFHWRWQWEKQYPNVAHRVVIESAVHFVHLHLPEEHAANQTWFTSFERAQEVTVYNSALLLLLILAETWDCERQRILPFTDLVDRPRPEMSSQPLLLPSATVMPNQVIEQIHHSVSYFLHPMHARSGVFVLYFPLWCWFVSQRQFLV